MKPVNLIWDDVMKKEARGLNSDDLDEVQNVGGDYVVATAGITDKTTYFFPKTLVQRCDGHSLVFGIFKDEAKDKYVTRDRPM